MDKEAIINRAEVVYSNFSKEDLIEYSIDKKSKNTKLDIFYSVIENIKMNEDILVKFYENFSNALGFRPSEVEKLLGLTSLERKKLQSLNKLKIIGNESFKKYGKWLEYPIFDFIETTNITEEDVSGWREEFKKEKEESKKVAVKKQKETLSKNNKARDDFKKEFKNTVKLWYEVDERLGATFELAFWTLWVSRLAKENQEKSYSAKSNKVIYEANKEHFYNLKNKAIECLIKSDFSEVSFYRPSEKADKVCISSFCENHYHDWRIERTATLSYISKLEYFYDNEREIKECLGCAVTIDEDYYSLYYLNVSSELAKEFNFSFHTPYNLGKDIFPPIETLELVEHKENAGGIFRFGRSLFEDEKIIYTEKTVINNFNKAYNRFNEVYI